MSTLLNRTRGIAISNAADAMITMTVTGSLSATLATLAGGRLLRLASRVKHQQRTSC